jgi:hypothetical protein
MKDARAHVHDADWTCCIDLTRTTPAGQIARLLHQPESVTDEQRRLQIARVQAWAVALDQVTRPSVLKINGQYEKGLISLDELIGQLTEVHFKGATTLLDSGEWTDLEGGR